ncbi:MAG: restriction endonuclease subunit S, partial [Enterococcus sp.]|nr:restriction endonuclease subunit S [Enterococcus sp.]
MIDTKLLRRKILDLAIRGRLVEQNPGGEPASVLLQRIHEEKQKMLADGNLKPRDIKNDSIIFRGDDNLFYEQVGNEEPVCIDDEIPFDIPDSWEWVRLGTLCNLQIGKTPARGNVEFWKNGVYPWVTISDIEEHKDLSNTNEYISQIALDSTFKSKLVPKGSLIMSFKLSIGKTCILGIDAVHNEAIISIQTYNDRMHYQRNFLNYMLPLLCTYGSTKNA